MPRRPCCRRVSTSYSPIPLMFKPAGVPARELEHVVMSLDELEALRLADGEKLYQEQAAQRMNVSRATFGRILDSAHKKVIDALMGGKVLRIEGGPVHADDERRLRCMRCGHQWESRVDHAAADSCPTCDADTVRSCGCGMRRRRRRRGQSTH